MCVELGRIESINDSGIHAMIPSRAPDPSCLALRLALSTSQDPATTGFLERRNQRRGACDSSSTAAFGTVFIPGRTRRLVGTGSAASRSPCGPCVWVGRWRRSAGWLESLVAGVLGSGGFVRGTGRGFWGSVARSSGGGWVGCGGVWDP